jgi:hypothetical protein
MIFKDAKEAIEANINARRLDHLRVKGVDLDSAGFDFSSDVAVA